MYLKRLELSGFKSFARKTTLLFSAPVTAVVGPNGAGKSNVADALRWALGEQSPTTIRGKRGEDFIFNGSHAAPRLNHASVSVVFDNSKKQFSLDYAEVVISRHVYRDGVNEYFINQSKVRLRDVLELIAAVGLGQSNHYIISQGEADRLLSASHPERMKMVEDALGLAIFEFKRKEALKKLDKTEENLRQVQSLRRELAPHLKYLKKQAEQLEKAEAIKTDLRALYLDYFRDEERHLKNSRAEIQINKNKHQHELGRIEKEKQALESLLKPDLSSSLPLQAQLGEAEGTLAQVRRTKDEVSRILGRLEGMLEGEKGLPKTGPYLVENGGRCSICGQKVTADSILKDRLQVERTRVLREQNSLELERQRDSAHSLLSDALKQEEVLTQRIAESRMAIEEGQEKTRNLDQRLFAVQSRQQELVSGLRLLRLQEEKLELEEADFKRESGEAAVLLGREVLNYQDYLQTQPERSRHEQDVRRRQIERQKIRIEEGGGGHSDVLKEFQELSERDQFLAREVVDLTQGVESLRKLMVDLGLELKVQFKAGLQKINLQFGAYFQVLFGGGNAALEIVTLNQRRWDSRSESNFTEVAEEVNAPKDQPEEGIEIKVSLPQKKIRGLQMLSGGERTLTSLALLFALSQVNPTPFLILDETDAALDEPNSKKYAEMLKELALKSQLIVVTHNRETMAHAGVLYGITMSKDAVSRILSLKFEEASTMAAR